MEGEHEASSCPSWPSCLRGFVRGQAMPLMCRAVSFVNAAVLTPDEVAASLRVARGRIASIGESPRRGDTVVDCEGAAIVPGLINAHDHLELNSFGRLKWRTTYANERGGVAGCHPPGRPGPP